MQCSVQTQEAAGANQQRRRMFGKEEQHFHIVQRIAAERKSYHFHSDLAMPLSMCSIQHPFQLLYLKLGMYLEEEQQPTSKHKNVNNRLSSHCKVHEQWFYAELVFALTKINAKFYLVKTAQNSLTFIELAAKSKNICPIYCVGKAFLHNSKNKLLCMFSEGGSDLLEINLSF